MENWSYVNGSGKSEKSFDLCVKFFTDVSRIKLNNERINSCFIEFLHIYKLGRNALKIFKPFMYFTFFSNFCDFPQVIEVPSGLIKYSIFEILQD